MTRTIVVFFVLIFAAAAPSFSAPEQAAEAPAAFDAKGDIILPGDFRSTWSHLGTWLVTSAPPVDPGSDRFAPGKGFHDTYTQPFSLQAYKKTGTWPDGAVIVMEVRSVNWDDLPTGHVMTQGEPVKWLVMVRDGKGRFPGNPHWGDGWGWALFSPNDRAKNLSTDYRSDCRGCHEPAKVTDWIFIQGYPSAR